MNRFIIRILLATAVAAAAGACVKEDRERHDPIVRLAFEPVLHAHVRSVVGAGTSEAAECAERSAAAVVRSDDSGDAAGMSFGVSAWQFPEEQKWETDQESAQRFLDAARLVRDGEVWLPESGDDWPSNRYTLTCIGFAPYEAAAGCDATNGVRFEEVDTSTDPGDLRYTQPQTDLVKSHNGGVVTLPLVQALCEVDFRVRGVNGYEDTEVYVRSITLDEVGIRGDFRSLPAPTWTLHGANAPLTLFEGEIQLEYTPQKAGQTRRLIPQTLNSTVTVEYEFLAPTGARLPQTDTTEPVKRTLEAGRHYTFTLAISPAGAEVIPELPDQTTESEAKP